MKRIDPKQRTYRTKLTDADREMLFATADDNPFSTTTELRKVLLEKQGKEICKSTACTELYRRPPMRERFSIKTPNTATKESNLERLYEMQLSYLGGFEDGLANGTIEINKVFFEDECPLFIGGLPRKGRSRRGKPIYARTPYMPKKYTMLAVISTSSWVKVDVIQGNTDDVSFRKFCLENTVPDTATQNLGGPPLPNLLPEGSFIVWDRLGRSGRCLDPCRIHYNKDIATSLRSNTIGVKFLPPKGSLINPIELFNHLIQERVKAWYPEVDPESDEYGRYLPGPRNFQECRVAVSNILEDLKNKSDVFEGMYRKRAFGDELRSRMENSIPAKVVIAERQEVIINDRWKIHEE